MPYIKREVRNGLVVPYPATPGELNYCITLLAKNYVVARGMSYNALNDVLGAIEGAKQEFYRRVAAPYEDQKMKENGDV
jgi:hypothetical protein